MKGVLDKRAENFIYYETELETGKLKEAMITKVLGVDEKEQNNLTTSYKMQSEVSDWRVFYWQWYFTTKYKCI